MLSNDRRRGLTYCKRLWGNLEQSGGQSSGRPKESFPKIWPSGLRITGWGKNGPTWRDPLTVDTKRLVPTLGCSTDEFKAYLQSKFKPGMTWKNYGSGWHIDHIKPCSHFDHTIESEVAACWHHTNMQPLWATENMRKGNRVNWKAEK